jgi:hypothetical protein
MNTVRVPSRTHAGHFYDVSIGIDGSLICSCPASFNHLECWHQRFVKEEMMTNEASKALVPVVVQPSTALLPTSRELDLVERAAAMIYAGGVSLPKELNTKEKVAAVMLYGLELGLRPMTAIQHLFLINGKLGASAQVMAGMCMAKEPDISFPVERLDAQVCTMRMIRPSRHLNEVMTVTWEQIKRAGLDRNPMNQQYPEDRLRYHVVKRLCRLVAPDLINNMDEGVPVAGLSDPGSWREDKALDDSDLYNEGDQPMLAASVAAPQAPEKPAAAPDELTAVYMQLLDARGKEAGLAVMAWALETFPQAAGKNGHLDRSKLTAGEGAWVLEEMRRYIKTGVARCPEDGHEATINPDTALMECSTCGYAMEQPEPVAVGRF